MDQVDKLNQNYAGKVANEILKSNKEKVTRTAAKVSINNGPKPSIDILK